MNKRALLKAIAAVRAGRNVGSGGEGAPADRATILSCVAALEAQYAETRALRPNACAAGNWSLVYSTKQTPPSSPARSAVDAISAQAYRVFFRFAPFLAGGQDADPGAGRRQPRVSVSNTQNVDVAAGRVCNTVTLSDSISRWRLRVVVAGDVREVCDTPALEPSDDVLAVTFTDFAVAAFAPRTGAADGEEAPILRLALPLPWPTGSLRTTFCDGDLRVSRGGQGGLFVVKRIP